MNSIFDRFFGRKTASASVAKERLQILVAQERSGRHAPDFLPLLQQEVLAVVAKYLDVGDDMIKIRFEKSGETSTLEINVELDKARYKTPPKSGEPKPVENKVSESKTSDGNKSPSVKPAATAKG